MDLLNLSLPDFALKWLEYLESRGRQESTIKRYLYDLKDFFDWKKDRDDNALEFNEWRQLDLDVYHEYFDFLINEKNYSDRTLHRILTVLKRMAIYYNSLNYKTNIPEIKKQLIDGQGKRLTENDFISEDEFKQLCNSIQSPQGLTKKQLKTRHLIIDRNLSIVDMMYHEGLTLSEIVSLNMDDLNFIRSIVHVRSNSSNSRKLTINSDRQKLYYDYYKTIPESVRPKWHTKEPFFVAFHFNLGTYHFVFNEKKEPICPKRITEIGIQRMLQKEVKRAGIRNEISSQHFRNSAILNAIKGNMDNVELMKRFGFKLELSLKRYLEYAKSIN